MGKFLDLTNRRFGKLVVVSQAPNINTRIAWNCICDCGNSIITSSNSLIMGRTKSCGCLRKEHAAAQSTLAGKIRGEQMKRHGHHGTRLYKVWKGMRSRCNNPNNKSFSEYGGRGIKICSEWDDFSKFELWAKNNGYNPNALFGECTIDRINVNGNYCPENCRWVDLKSQANNRRPRRSVKHNAIN